MISELGLDLDRIASETLDMKGASAPDTLHLIACIKRLQELVKDCFEYASGEPLLAITEAAAACESEAYLALYRRVKDAMK